MESYHGSIMQDMPGQGGVRRSAPRPAALPGQRAALLLVPVGVPGIAGLCPLWAARLRWGALRGRESAAKPREERTLLGVRGRPQRGAVRLWYVVRGVLGFLAMLAVDTLVSVADALDVRTLAVIALVLGIVALGLVIGGMVHGERA